MNVQSAQRRWTTASAGEPPPEPSPTEPNESDAEALPASVPARPDFPAGTAPTPGEPTRAFDALLPVSRFSPSPGLTVDRSGSSVAISGVMELSGDEATPERAATIQDTINRAWNRTFPDGTSVTCQVRVAYRPPGSTPSPDATQIIAEKMHLASEIDRGLTRTTATMRLNAKESDAFTWVPAHEFGHVLGLGDRYSESFTSWLGGRFGLPRTTTPLPGWAGNLMASTGGTADARNVPDIAVQKEGSFLAFMQDDDQVAGWVSAHTTADIQKLPTADKLRAIQTLQGGLISGRDLAAMGRICASVSSHS
ncbi:MAG: hypothetical protein JOZ69_01130, partial [Myxococcales bacterium]|nr:hypothetical protein [Myxococcales bacterium]